MLAHVALLATVDLALASTLKSIDLWRPCMSIAHPIRVLLVHNHPLARQALRAILQTFYNIFIVGEATTGEEAMERAGTLQPTIVVMDISLPALPRSQ